MDALNWWLIPADHFFMLPLEDQKESATMIEAWSYHEVCRVLSLLRERHPQQNGAGVRMVGLLFAPPAVQLVRNEIVPSIEDFHHRSGLNIDFFCAGYCRYGGDRTGRPVTKERSPWRFSASRFNYFRGEIEHLSAWRYSGEVDLLLTNAEFDKDANVSLDFRSAIVCDLDRMMRDGAILSVRRFFEDICDFADHSDSSDPTWGFSDAMGLRVGGSALKRVALSLLPRRLGDDYKRVEHFAIRDISRGLEAALPQEDYSLTTSGQRRRRKRRKAISPGEDYLLEGGTRVTVRNLGPPTLPGCPVVLVRDQQSGVVIGWTAAHAKAAYETLGLRAAEDKKTSPEILDALARLPYIYMHWLGPDKILTDTVVVPNRDHPSIGFQESGFGTGAHGYLWRLRIAAISNSAIPRETLDALAHDSNADVRMMAIRMLGQCRSDTNLK